MMTLNVSTRRSRRRYLAVFGALSLLFSLVAQTGFGISPAGASDAFVIVNDDGGVNQQDSPAGGAQSDLTRFGIDNTHVATDGFLWLQWSWDRIDFTSQTGDACALFDNDSDGNANYSLCVSVQNTPAGGSIDPTNSYTTTAAPLLFVCKDNNPDRCGQPSSAGVITTTDMLTLGGDTATTTSTLVTNTDPFPGGEASPKDTTIVLKIAVADLPAGAELLNVCSYPSIANGGNNAPGDCVVTPGAGFLTIVKQTVTATTAPFGFTLNPAASDGQTVFTRNGPGVVVDRKSVTPGNAYSLAESSVPAGWQLDSASCQIVGATGSTGTFAGSAVTGFSVQSGKETVCTFTNSLAGVAPVADVVKGNVAGDDNVATIDEPGGLVTIPVVVGNSAASGTGDATLTSLIDDVYGDITVVAGAVTATTCSVPQTVIGGGSYSCDFTVSLTSIGTVTDTVTAVLENALGTDSASDQANTVVSDVPSSIEVTKTASPDSVDEPGGDVTFGFVVNNTSAVDSVTIDTLDDSIYGDLDGQGDCSVPQTIAAGASYFCSFTALVSATETNVVTASGLDDDDNPVSDDDDATVTIDDVPSSIEVIKTANPISVPENGGNVTYTFTVNNTSATDFITISSLDDSIYGDLDGQGDCVTPQGMIAPGTGYSCSITEAVTGNAGAVIDNVLTVAGVDDDGNPVGGTDNATVTITDTPSSIEVTKSAIPTSVPETGGDVTFTVTVENASLADDVTINSVVDDLFGDVSASCLPALPATLAPGESITCAFTEFISGDAADTHTNVTTASGEDDDGNPVEDDDFEDVTFDDVLGSIEVIKTANPTSVDEPGGNVTFSFVVNNTSAVDSVTIDSLTDTIYGDLNGQGDCSVPQTIALGGSYNCSFTVFVAGNAGDIETNVVTASGIDDDDQPVSDDDDATVTITDVPSSILTTKSASPSSVPETGGDVTFMVTVENTSLVDDVTISSVVDSEFGDVSTSCVPALPALLAPRESITCSFTEFLSGDASDAHTNVVTASGVDDDSNPVEDDDDETVPFDDVLPDITVVKTADLATVPETGGDVTFTFDVTNNSSEATTLDSLVDSDFGDLNGQGNCVTPQALTANGEAGDSYTCSVTVFISGDASGPDHNNVVTATASDDDDNTTTDDDDETVVLEDVLPDVSITKTAIPTSVPETGGDVEFTIVVTNNSLEGATIDSLVDSDFDLAAHCIDAVGTVLPFEGSYTCTFTETLVGDASSPDHENTATVVASDGDGNTDTKSDEATVTFTDVLPDVSITKIANPTSVDEPGADVEFTIVVTNNSLEDATIDSLIDSDFDLAANCADAAGTVLASGESYTCTFTEFVAGNTADGDHENTATAVALDDDGNTDTESDDETVVISNVDPSIVVTKTPNQDEVFAPGEDVTFTISVENNSVTSDPVTITSIVDDVFGDVSAECVLPQTIGTNATFECDITRNITTDHTNTVTVTAEDDEGTEVSDSDDASVDVINPSVAIEKSTNGFDDDTAPGHEILVGADVTWTYKVTNNGDVPQTNILVVDDQLGDICTIGSLGVGLTATCEADGLAVADGYSNLGTASTTYTDVDGDTAEREDSDPSNYFGAAPSVDITKAFADDSVIAGGTGSSFTLVVKNDGNVDLDAVSITDTVDGDLVVSTVSSGDADCSASADQDVDCVVDLAVGELATVTVNFSVDSDTLARDAVSNTANAADTYNDDVGNSTDIGDEDSDTIDILTDIDLSIIKTFTPTTVSQGTPQSFTIEVTNSGPSDAVDVSVLDSVDISLAVTGVDCDGDGGPDPDSAGQDVDCLVDIEAGETVTITVYYLAAPFLTGSPSVGTIDGSRFKFLFVNGSILEGSANGLVYLDGEEIEEGKTKNDYTFNAPDGSVIDLHLSCSDAFTGGWGDFGGPDQVDDPDWQIAFFSITRYKRGDFFKSCENVVAPLQIPNTANASGTESEGTNTVTADAVVTIGPGVTVDRFQANGKKITVTITSPTSEPKEIKDVSISWPSANGQLKKVSMDGTTVWSGSVSPGSTLLNASESGWNGGSLPTGESKLRFDFSKKVQNSGYVVTVNFSDGTSLDISN